MELLAPSFSVVGPSAVHTHRGTHPRSPLGHSRRLLAPIPRRWGATPVAPEVGCGTGELHRSRRLAFANLDLGGSGLVEGCTGKASTILTSSDRENTTISLSLRRVGSGNTDWHERVPT